MGSGLSFCLFHYNQNKNYETYKNYKVISNKNIYESNLKVEDINTSNNKISYLDDTSDDDIDDNDTINN